MKFQILTLFPNYFESSLKEGILGRAIKKSVLTVDLVDIKFFTKKERADDYPFGGRNGMLMRYEPLKNAIESLKTRGRVIYLSPQGEKWSAKKSKEYAKSYKTLTLVCGRYGGVDGRFIRDFVDEELSVGDYILNGGEVASLVIIESLSRFLNGFLGNEESYKKESFENGLLDSPDWTRPREIAHHKLPELIFRGNHEQIKQFHFYSSLLLTALKRPDLLEDQETLKKQIPEAVKFLSQLNQAELDSIGLRKKGQTLVLTDKSRSFEFIK